MVTMTISSYPFNIPSFSGGQNKGRELCGLPGAFLFYSTEQSHIDNEAPNEGL